MAENETNEAEEKATPLAAADPTEVPAVYGATFAERAAAREQSSKAVRNDDAEDKAVKSSSTKSRRGSKK